MLLKEAIQFAHACELMRITRLKELLTGDDTFGVWDRPTLGVSFKVNEAKKRLAPEDSGFFD
jgi:hypothetical protein